jgi:hypothetical protein
MRRLCTVLSTVLLLFTAPAFAFTAENEDQALLEGRLQETINYYKPHSVKILKKESFSGEVQSTTQIKQEQAQATKAVKRINEILDSTIEEVEVKQRLQKQIKNVMKEELPDKTVNKSESYETSIDMYYIEYDMVRDSVFTFRNRSIEYFDTKNQTFLAESTVNGNPQAESFAKENETVIKERTPQTDMLILLAIALTFGIAFFIPFFASALHGHNASYSNRSTNYHA